MKVSIQDRELLSKISAVSLVTYASSVGWNRSEVYREHSDIYIGEKLPEIIIPRTEHLGDYASVVSTLIKTFAEVSHSDELTIFRCLEGTDRDVVRVRVSEVEGGTLALNHGHKLITGARDMVLSAGCSLSTPQFSYRAGAHREANDFLSQMRIGHTEQGSFIVTLFTPVIPSPMPSLFPDEIDHEAPMGRRVMKRLIEASIATRQALEQTTAGIENAFKNTVEKGVSANSCEALALMVESFESLEISVSWARTRPLSMLSNSARFSKIDSPVLKEAARFFKTRSPKLDQTLFGFVRLLKREEEEADGDINLATTIEEQNRSVKATLQMRDYEKALLAHKEKAMVVLKGDLEHSGNHWRLLNPKLKQVIPNE